MSADDEWSIEPDGMRLVRADGRTQFEPAEFDRQRWPLCPVCGDPIEVDAIDASSRLAGESRVIVGRWRCARGCDVAGALR